MAKTGLRNSFELETRNRYTKVECEIGLTVNGRELPSMAILGEALETAIEMIQEKIKESYKENPPRVSNPSTGVVKNPDVKVTIGQIRT